MNYNSNKTSNKMHNNQHQSFRQLSEGLEYGDLARLIHPKLHVDEFKSKMGDDADIILISFKVGGKEPATDLMNFIERGYDWVLDADVSAGELDDGEYLVFVEFEREPHLGAYILKLMDDLMNLTEQDLDQWKFQYRKSPREYDLTLDNIRSVIPQSPEEYLAKYGDEENVEDEEDIDPEDPDKELAAMQEAARVPFVRKAPVNSYTDSLRVAAGLK
jgi:hypothetical protein